MDLIKVSYEISEQAREEAFVKRGEHIPINESKRAFVFDIRETTEEERSFVWEMCNETEDGGFIYDSGKLDSVCENLEQFQKAVEEQWRK